MSSSRLEQTLSVERALKNGRSLLSSRLLMFVGVVTVGCSSGELASSESCAAGEIRCDGVCVDVSTNPAHCGGCDIECPTLPNTTALCDGGSCETRCVPGWSDRTEEPGCETECEPNDDVELCNGEDDDCDGIIDNDFPCAAGQEVECTTACGTAGRGLCSSSCERPSSEQCHAQELCNGLDDDCDDLLDEDFSCSAGQRERRACGACDTGEQARGCSDECAWGDWSACVGARTDFPFDPVTDEAVCPPYTRPAVFFSPHPDDETIGMAGAILEHLSAGRDVFVELMTHGEASGVRGRLDDGETCPWHAGSHVYSLSEDEFGDARVREFMDAVTRMGVTGVFVSDFGDGDVETWEVDTRIDFWLVEGGDELSLKGTVGSDDLTSGGTYHDDHDAVWNALISCGYWDIRGYFAYIYAGGLGAPDRAVDISTWCAGKGDAIDAYELWDPDNGRYAIGYHSVPAYFDDARSSCMEYVGLP